MSRGRHGRVRPAAFLLAAAAVVGLAPAAATEFVGDAGGAGDASPRPWVELISWKPRAYLYHNFLSEEECDHIIAIATPHIRRSSVVNMDGSVTDDPIRTSWGTFLARAQDEVIYAIEQRIANWTHIPVEHAEDMQVLRYSNNQTYGAHWDDLDLTENPEGLGGGSVRVATVLMYLSDAEYGGETAFPSGRWLDKEKQTAGQPFSECASTGPAALPRKGNAVLFWDAKPGSMRQDKWSLHTGCPVIRGTKWAGVKWIHAKRFGGPYPSGPLATSGASLAAAEKLMEMKQERGDAPQVLDSCKDENTMCRDWAANGECAKNPKFMKRACALSCRECCPLGDVLCERQRRRVVVKPTRVGAPKLQTFDWGEH